MEYLRALFLEWQEMNFPVYEKNIADLEAQINEAETAIEHILPPQKRYAIDDHVNAIVYAHQEMAFYAGFRACAQLMTTPKERSIDR